MHELTDVRRTTMLEISATQPCISRLAIALDTTYATAMIMATGVTLRLLYLLLIAGRPFSSDAKSYAVMAADLAAGRSFIPFWPPGVPIYLAGVQALFGGSTIATRVAMLAFYFGLSYCLYRATICLTGKRSAGNLALLLLAISPGFVVLSVEPVTETPAAMFLALAVYCLLSLSAREKLARNLIATTVLGFALGCLCLIRPASLALLVFIPIYCVWRTRKVVLGGLGLIIPALMVAVWIIHVHDTTGRIVAINTANAKNLYLGNNPETPIYRTWWLGSHHQADANVPDRAGDHVDLSALDATYDRLAMAYIQGHPGLFLLRSFNRMCVFFAFDTYAGDYLIRTYQYPQILGLLVIGLGGLLYCVIAVSSIVFVGTLARNKETAACITMLMSVLLLYAAPYFVAFSHPRYRIPVEPILMMLSPALFVRLAYGSTNTIRNTLRNKKWKLVTAVCCFVSIQIEFAAIVYRYHS